MALTYRTGSGSNPGKGSALTIDELDNNFRHFTGSHSVTGSLEVSGSVVLTGSLDISGSIEGEINGSYSQQGNLRITGSLIVSGSNTLENIGTFENIGLADLKAISPSSVALTVSGSSLLTGSLVVSQIGTSGIFFENLRTTDSGIAGELWVDPAANYVLKVSQ
jgi:hypothetical protein